MSSLNRPHSNSAFLCALPPPGPTPMLLGREFLPRPNSFPSPSRTSFYASCPLCTFHFHGLYTALLRGRSRFRRACSLFNLGRPLQVNEYTITPTSLGTEVNVYLEGPLQAEGALMPQLPGGGHLIYETQKTRELPLA